MKTQLLSTTCEGKDVLKDSKTFESVTCYLNFNEDFVKFEFSSLSGVSIEKKLISYEKVNSQTYRAFVLKLPITSDESTSDSNVTTVEIQANVKDVLLNLFSPHRKQFRLTVDYTRDDKKYQTTFFALIPVIDQK